MTIILNLNDGPKQQAGTGKKPGRPQSAKKSLLWIRKISIPLR